MRTRQVSADAAQMVRKFTNVKLANPDRMCVQTQSVFPFRSRLLAGTQIQFMKQRKKLIVHNLCTEVCISDKRCRSLIPSNVNTHEHDKVCATVHPSPISERV